MNNVQDQSMIDEVLGKGVMRIAVALTDPPDKGLSEEYYRDPETGKPEGVVIDYMKLMAGDLGVEPEWVEIPWKDQVDALISGDIDILPKHTNTPDRALKVDFADRLISFEVLIVVLKENPQTFSSLNQDNRVIACARGSSNIQLVQHNFPRAKIVEVDEYLDGAEALESGDVHAWVESPITKTLLEKRPRLDVIRDSRGEVAVLSKDYAHPAVKLGDQRAVNWINNWIKFRMARGELDSLVNKRWRSNLLT